MAWLSGMDSNHDKELQRLLCYHYTTGQVRSTLAAVRRERKGKNARIKRPPACIKLAIQA